MLFVDRLVRFLLKDLLLLGGTVRYGMRIVGLVPPGAGAGRWHGRFVPFVRAAGEAMSGDFALQELLDCTIDLLSSSTVLWIRGLKRCTVFALPRPSSTGFDSRMRFERSLVSSHARQTR